jgi:hypothetical protein
MQNREFVFADADLTVASAATDVNQTHVDQRGLVIMVNHRRMHNLDAFTRKMVTIADRLLPPDEQRSLGDFRVLDTRPIGHQVQR